jgi:hypothetical protein
MNPTWFKHPFDILIILVMTKAPASFFAIQWRPTMETIFFVRMLLFHEKQCQGIVARCVDQSY